VSYFEAAGAVVKIGLSLKPNHHKVAQIRKTHFINLVWQHSLPEIHKGKFYTEYQAFTKIYDLLLFAYDLKNKSQKWFKKHQLLRPEKEGKGERENGSRSCKTFFFPN